MRECSTRQDVERNHAVFAGVMDDFVEGGGVVSEGVWLVSGQMTHGLRQATGKCSQQQSMMHNETLDEGKSIIYVYREALRAVFVRVIRALHMGRKEVECRERAAARVWGGERFGNTWV